MYFTIDTYIVSIDNLKLLFRITVGFIVNKDLKNINLSLKEH